MENTEKEQDLNFENTLFEIKKCSCSGDCMCNLVDAREANRRIKYWINYYTGRE